MLPRRGCSGDADEVAADGGAAGFGVGKGSRGTGRAQQVVADGGRREPAGVGGTEPAGRWAVARRSLRGALSTRNVEVSTTPYRPSSEAPFGSTRPQGP